MFKYTREALSQIIDDIKKYCKIFKYGSLILTMSYFIYSLISGYGIFVANLILLIILSLYTLFEIITNNKNIKKLKRIVKRSYKWSNIIIKAFILGPMLYGIYTATTHISAISTIITTLMIIMWILQLFLEILIEVIENKADLLIEAYNQDVKDIKDTVKKPITAITNGFNKLRGKEVNQEPEKTKNIKKLEERIAEKVNNKEAK